MKRRTYYSFFLIASIMAVSFLYIFLSSKETFVPGIPDKAIRLRILANSDQLEDQVVKRKVRDVVVKEMNTWVRNPENIEDARILVQNHLPRFQEIAEETVAQYGHTYSVQVDFKEVPFPTKLYGNQVYPAGNYEALRVTLGKGEGGNWWCVLFPPLCFVDMSNGDAVPTQNHKEVSPSTEGHVYAATGEKEEYCRNKEINEKLNTTQKEDKVVIHKERVEKKKAVDIRFFFIEKMRDIFYK